MTKMRKKQEEGKFKAEQIEQENRRLEAEIKQKVKKKKMC
jgi:hypothetical protein